MSNLPRALLALFVFILMLAGGCKKSVEGQDKAWKSNVASVTELSAQYPGFKAPLEARKTSAQAIYDAAASITDEEAKIAKLSEANSAINKGFVSDLKGLDAQIKKLRDARVEVTAKAGDSASQAAAKLAAKDAEQTLARIEKTLATGAKDDAAATAILKKVTADLKAAQSAIDKVAKVDQSKKDDKKAEVDEKAAAAAAAKADAEAKVAPWTCEFCQSSNAHDVHKCGSCGAPRPAAKDAAPKKEAAPAK